jgi:hypothetical protein
MFDLEILVKRWIRPSMVEVFIQQKFMFVKLSCVAQLLVQRAPASGVESERFAFAQEHHTVGQRVRTIARNALHGLLKLAE